MKVKLCGKNHGKGKTVANELEGRRVAILLAPVGTEQAEFIEPKKAVEDAGAQVDVVASRPERPRR